MMIHHHIFRVPHALKTGDALRIVTTYDFKETSSQFRDDPEINAEQILYFIDLHEKELLP